MAVEDCDQALFEIYGKVKKNLAQGKGSKHMVVNFGVAAGRTMISLETLGKNIKDFRVADERGNKFAQLPIDPGFDKDQKISCSSLNLAAVCDLMKKTHPVELSTNAGEYICNYMYYKNLKIQCELASQYPGRVHSLFVHVPQFDKVKETDQQNLVCDLL